ncbi:MAG: HlyD family efflux transporter periplasmic adaptor subunit, partial [Bacteroidota bacterium]
MRKYASVLIGVVIIAAGIITFRLMNIEANDSSNNANTNAAEDIVPVKVDSVILTAIPYKIEATGTLRAKERIELYSEVQGVVKKTQTPFKIGNTFRKSELLVMINSEEHNAQIKSSRSDLINQIAAMLPDMEIDYPEAYKKWETYLEQLNVNKKTPALPAFSSNEEKLFVSGKSIYRTFYNIKNLEERLNKYFLRAPFNGIVTESNINVGTLIRSGQKIGEFIDDSTFELELSIAATDYMFLNEDTPVTLEDINSGRYFSGQITRVNGKIDQDTQSITIIVEVNDEAL